MKLPVTKYVNARSGEPLTSAAICGYRSPGEIISIDDIVSGTEIDGNLIWYHCADDGCFYWSGAFDDIVEVLNAAAPTTGYAFYRSAANELGSKYSHIPGYRGIAAGYKVLESQGGLVIDKVALIFFVDKKIAANLPGIPNIINYRGLALITDVRIIGPVELQATNPDTSVPLMMGGSIASLNDMQQEHEIGTRSVLVIKGGNEYLLTCYHVACSTLMARNQYEFRNEDLTVRMPAKIISPQATAITGKVVEGAFGITYDYALIRVDTSQLDNAIPKCKFNNGYYTLNELANGLANNTKFFIHGAVNKSQSGLFKAYPFNDFPADRSRGLILSGLVEIERISKKGDSGAPVVDEHNKFLGFIVAAEKSSSYVMPIDQLTFDFHFSLNL